MIFYVLGYFGDQQFDLGHFNNIDIAKGTAVMACGPYGFQVVKILRCEDDSVDFIFTCTFPSNIDEMRTCEDAVRKCEPYEKTT